MTDKDTGVHIGKFTILRRLGRGGMGAVYEGRDPALDRLVAIKTLTTDIISDKDSRSRFEREARAAAKLQHANIVTIYELGNFGGEEQPYIVMEYLEGTDVSALIGADGMPIAEALDITIQLCHALDFAHQNGVVHRDIKPANLRYLDNGQIKIMDFGIARVEGSQQITKSGVMVGTLHYMSPEQIRGQKLDGRTDIFSAGCILYELLTGKKPFPGDSATSILYNIVNETPAPLLEQNPDIPQEIQDLLDHALAKKADERFATAGNMARDIDKLLSVYRKTLPRTPPVVQERLEELDELSKSQDWQSLVPKAKSLVEVHPQLDDARRHLRRALRELQQKEREQQQTAADRTKHMREISHEISGLYGPHALTQQGLSEETEVASAPETAVIGGAPPVAPEATAAAAPTASTVAAPDESSVSLPPAESTAAVRALAAPIWALVIVVILGLIGGTAWMFLREPPGPATIGHTIRVVSEPAGATVLLDGTATGIVTTEGGVQLEVSGLIDETHVIELTLDGHESASSQFTLTEEPPAELEFSLVSTAREFDLKTVPDGVSVRLDGEDVTGVTPLLLTLSEGSHELVLSKSGFNPATITLAAADPLPEDAITLARIGRPGTFRVDAAYPVEIRRGGRQVAAPSTNASVQLRAGTHELVLYAPDVFLRRTVQVTIREDDTTVQEAPVVGRVSVRANPGNCTVTISGMSAGAPPFMNREVVTGQHEFVFTWPGDVTDVQSVSVSAGQPSFVIGQRP